MVVTRAPATSETGTPHECTGFPSRCTMQAPHLPIPQAYFVPVKPSCSRITHNSGVSDSTSTLYGRPLTRSSIITFSSGALRAGARTPGTVIRRRTERGPSAFEPGHVEYGYRVRDALEHHLAERFRL